MRRPVSLAILLACAFTSACKDSTGPGQSQKPRNAIYAVGGFLSILYRVPLSATGTDSMIAPIHTSAGVNLQLTDLALAPNGGLWAVTSEELYRIDPATALATRIGTLGATDMNALTFAPNGQLMGAGLAGSLSVIDTVTGLATLVGNYGHSLLSSGDIAYAANGTLYATILGVGTPDMLVTVNTTTGEATPAGSAGNIGYPNVWGLVFVDGQLYGLTDGANISVPNGVLLRIDPGTGAGTQLRALSFKTYGAARPRSPVPH